MEGNVFSVALYVSESIFGDTTGADVDASIKRYADILQEQMETQAWADTIQNLEIHEVRETPYQSIVIIVDDSEVERVLYDEIVALEQEILAGKYGDWIVEEGK